MDTISQSSIKLFKLKACYNVLIECIDILTRFHKDECRSDTELACRLMDEPAYKKLRIHMDRFEAILKLPSLSENKRLHIVTNEFERLTQHALIMKHNIEQLVKLGYPLLAPLTDDQTRKCKDRKESSLELVSIHKEKAPGA